MLKYYVFYQEDGNNMRDPKRIDRMSGTLYAMYPKVPIVQVWCYRDELVVAGDKARAKWICVGRPEGNRRGW